MSYNNFVVIRDLTIKIFISIYLKLSDGLYFETGLYQGHIYHGFYRGLYQGYTFLYIIFCSRAIFIPVAIFAHPTGQIELSRI